MTPFPSFSPELPLPPRVRLYVIRLITTVNVDPESLNSLPPNPSPPGSPMPPPAQLSSTLLWLTVSVPGPKLKAPSLTYITGGAT